jgi:hypothetical protein
MRRKLGGSFILTMAVCSFAAKTQAGTIYSLAGDWSDVSNPNGVWSYNEGSNPLPAVAEWLPAFLPGGQPAWANSASGFGHVPVWFRSAVAPPAGFDWNIGDVVMHSTDNARGENYGLANVTWTSAVTGTIDVSGGIWLGVDRGRGNHWAILVNGSVISEGDIFSGDAYSRSSPFDFAAGSGGAAALNDVLIAPGDVVTLQITRTTRLASSPAFPWSSMRLPALFPNHPPGL